MELQNNNRQQLTNVLGIFIVPARCAHYLKLNIANSEIDNQIKELQTKVKSGTLTPEEVVTTKKEISKLSQHVIRISSETSTIMAIICNGMVEDLIKHGIKQINDPSNTNNKKNQLNLLDIVTGDHKSNPFYPLYSKLPLFENFNKEEYEANKKEKTAVQKKKKAKEDAEAEPKEEKEEETVNESSKNNFTSYIGKIKDSINPNKEVSLKMAADCKEYLSSLVIELIKCFVSIVKINIETTKSRTINSTHIKTSIKLLLTINNLHNSDISNSPVIKYFEEKLTLFQEHQKQVKANKPAPVISDEEKKAKELKKKEAEEKKKEKAIQLAKERLDQLIKQ